MAREYYVQAKVMGVITFTLSDMATDYCMQVLVKGILTFNQRILRAL